MQNHERKLFLEVELGLDLHPCPLPDKTKEDILLFFKLYDPEKEELRYVGRLFVKALGKPADILSKLNEMAGFSPSVEIQLFEEIKFEPNVMCDHIDNNVPFHSSQLEDGDIICYQKSLPLGCNDQIRYPDLPSFLEYIRNRQIPEEEKNLGPQDRLIHVYHSMKDPNQNQMIQNFGEPFFMAIREDETLAEVKVRIQKKLQILDEELSKWKFAFVSVGRPDYLQDSDIISVCFQRRDVYGAWEQYLGLEHSDAYSKRAYSANQNRHTFDKTSKNLQLRSLGCSLLLTQRMTTLKLQQERLLRSLILRQHTTCPLNGTLSQV